MCIYLMIILVYVYDFVLHVLITCLDVAFIKTCVYTYTTSESQINYYMFMLNCLFVPIRCTSIV